MELCKTSIVLAATLLLGCADIPTIDLPTTPSLSDHRAVSDAYLANAQRQLIQNKYEQSRQILERLKRFELTFELSSEQRALFELLQGELAYEDRNWQEAKNHYQLYLKELGSQTSSDTLAIATATVKLGRAELALGNTDIAETQLYDALSLLEKAGPNNILLGDILHYLALVEYYREDNISALVQYHGALQVRMALPSPHPVDAADTLNNIGLVYLDEDYASSAKSFFQRAIVRYETEKGKGHRASIISYYNLARSLWELGEHDSSVAMLKQQLERSKREYGTSHETTSMIYEALANYVPSQRYRRKYRLEAAKIQLSLGNATEYYDTMITIAANDSDDREVRKALKVLSQAAHNGETAWGESSVPVDIWVRMSGMDIFLGKTEDAIEHLANATKAISEEELSSESYNEFTTVRLIVEQTQLVRSHVILQDMLDVEKVLV
jgi:Tetratricopeptide repeat